MNISVMSKRWTLAKLSSMRKSACGSSDLLYTHGQGARVESVCQDLEAIAR